MKKVYLLGLALMVGGLSANAQRTAKNYSFGHQTLKSNLESNNTTPNRPVTTANSGDRALNILWTEDFTGGMTTGNGTYTPDAGLAESSFWTIASTAHPLSAFGWTNAMTGDHLRWDSYNPNSAEAAFATTVVNGAIISPLIDLSGSASASAILQFDTETMYCCNFQEFPWFVYISNDGGTTYGAGIPLDFGVDRNVATEDIAHPMTYSMDITSGLDPVAANNNDVVIKIAWEATNADGNGQINTHYFWMLDNMVIFEVPPFEAQHQRLWLEDIALGYEYGDIPTSQGQALTVQSKFLWLGANLSPTNFGQEVTVFNGGTTTVVHGPETGGTLTNPLATGIVDTVTFTSALDVSTLATGMYDVRVVISYDETDEVPSNDTLWRSFMVTDTKLSHMDYDQGIGVDDQNATTKAEIGATFPIYNSTALQGIDIYIDDAVSGDFVDVLLYQDNGATIDYLAGPWTFEITAGMIGGWTTLNLHQALQSYTPIPLGAGNSYVPVVVVDPGQVFDYGSQSADEDNSGIFWHDNDGTWYLTGEEPLIAMNFDVSLAIESQNDLDFSVGQNMPNPFDNTSVISYTLENAANVAVDFKDVSGKVVKTINNGSQAAGSYTLNVDANDFAEGVYFYTFSIGEKQITKRMVITK